ncbi:MAG: DUF1553 domain-containing protein [Bryobacteraceae bacterium]|nr:DUF1553 domain-containing protein [Bryobacteraceae bacterium]
MKLPLLTLVSFSLCSAEIDFNRDVRPILSDKCYTCHGPDQSKRITPLRLDSEPGSRAAIVAGKPQESRLIQRVRSDDPARRMPPQAMGHARLSDAEIAKLEQWIREGARWQSHWSLVPPKKGNEPATANRAWVANPIDSYILKRLEEAGLAPSPEAGRATLIRRVSLDLTGLPPTPGEVEAFVQDRSANAYEKVIDRLLSSPAYGERMAARWLDAARYADTNGYQNDQERYMWRWRDWVIEAFNRNMPFDQFTIEQLAGDLLPNPTLSQRIATGFNRNHRGNAENGTDPREYQVEYAVDRLETTATVWLGLTMGCARCHDHKYDPVTQRDFYRFYAYFNNVSDRGRYFKYGNTPPFVLAPTPAEQEKLAALDTRIEKARVAAAAQQAAHKAALQAWPGEAWSFEESLLVASGGGALPIDLGDKADFDFYARFTLAARIRPESPTGGVIARYHESSRGYGLFLIDGKLQLRLDTASISDRTRVETVDAIPLNEWSHVAATYDGSRLAAGMKIFVNGREQKVRVLIDESLNSTRAGKGTTLRLGYGPQKDQLLKGRIEDARIYTRALAAEEVAVAAVAESVPAIAAMKQRSEAQQRKLAWAFYSRHSPEWNQLRKLRLEREKLVDSFSTVMVMDEMADTRPTHILYRGAFDAPRERVDPGVPASLPPLSEGLPNNRLGLAKWLTSPTHPLTARVTVNRFWQMLFGAGIVRTVEDFGSQGAAPSHPELLDWLAVEFIEGGWDVKRLLKTMVMSATYRQSARVTPHLLERDPENVLLARAPRLRLPAESLRDQALAVAGLLTTDLGGPSVKPYQPAGLWEELSNAGPYRNDHGGKLYRRSLYTFWKRTLGPPAMLAFDSAARETCVVRESRTNTPIQALNMMNDVTYTEAARVFAERMIREGGADAGARLAYGFRLATARQPESGERDILVTTLKRYEDRYQSRPADALKYLSHGEHKPDSAIPAHQLAAYTAVASMMLNLDETINRE